MPAAGSSVKMSVILPAALIGVPADVLKSIKQFETAANRHNTKAEKVVTKVKGEKAKIRDAAEADFQNNVDQLKALLAGAGLKEANIVTGSGMFGTVVYVKLPKGGVVSIGKADTTKFNAAKKAAAAAATQ